MAEAAGAELGSVRTITDVVGSSGPYPYAMESASRAMADTSMPIAAGSQDLTVQVKVVFELR